jgi:hypothetical protein
MVVLFVLFNRLQLQPGAKTTALQRRIGSRGPVGVGAKQAVFANMVVRKISQRRTVTGRLHSQNAPSSPMRHMGVLL